MKCLMKATALQLQNLHKNAALVLVFLTIDKDNRAFKLIYSYFGFESLLNFHKVSILRNNNCVRQ